MKPTEFIKESIDSAEYNDEAGSVKTLTQKHKSYTNQRSAGGPVKVKK